jgi:glycosyltransferase involved in cell wall biosynthesis
MKTLLDFYKSHTGKVSDKWSLYLREYDRLFAPYRDQAISMLEIGVQNGGSLEIWSLYFPNAQKFVGCDINPDCAKLTYADPRIAVIVGDATTPETQVQVLAQSASFDLIIEDGSHTSSDIVKAFARYFPALKSGGLFVAEDLHCSYWQDYEGGIFHPYSSITFFKHLADVVNHEHWGVERNRTDLIAGFKQLLGVDFEEEMLSQISSIEFINSICIVRKRSADENSLAERVITGCFEDVMGGHLELSGSMLGKSDQALNMWSNFKWIKSGVELINMTESGLHSDNLSEKWQTLEGVEMDKEIDLAIAGVNSANVAVIIPYYNGSRFIVRALKSVFSQSVKAQEVVVVNDGSTEVEAEFLNSLSSEFEIKILHKNNGGQGSARNYGVEHTVSRYISFLDQDDFYLPRHIEDLLNAIPVADVKFGFVYGDLCEADGDGNIVRIGMVKEHSMHPKIHINNLISQDMFVLPSASLIAREAYLAVGGFDPQFMGYEDDDLFLRIFRSGYTNTYLDKPVTTWCIHQESTSYSVKMSRSRFRYLKKLINLFPDNPAAARFYFRDLMMPRFHGLIVSDALSYKIKKLPGEVEVVGILNEYVGLICKNTHIKLKMKIKMKLIAFCVNNFNGFFLKMVVRVWRG